MMDPTLPIGMLVALFVLLIIGIPAGVAIAVSGFLFGVIGFGFQLFDLVPSRVYGVITNTTLLAIPLFVFMGLVLERSRLAEDLLEVVGHLAGNLRGGMALAIILVGVLMGASTGIVGATVVTLTLLTLGTFIQRQYSIPLACGTICASGTLGQILPPSLILIVLAEVMGIAVGSLFAAAIVPGMLLAAAYVAYLLILGALAPKMAPAISAEERAGISGGELALKFCKVVVPPIALILAVLGSIIGGVAAPTEAASVGALGSLLIARFLGHFGVSDLRAVAERTLVLTGMVFFILIAAQVFALSFRGLGGDGLVRELFDGLPGGVMGQLLFFMLVIFVLGFFLEWIEITLIAIPLMLPIFQHSGIDFVWLAMLVCVNLQTSFLTPPFGWALFFLKGAAPPQVTTLQIYKGVLPYIGIQIAVLGLLFWQPQLVLWLPEALGW